MDIDRDTSYVVQTILSAVKRSSDYINKGIIVASPEVMIATKKALYTKYVQGYEEGVAVPTKGAKKKQY